ncbi:MAG: hypothetical protein EBR86_03150 [Planctomycetia bacterium]|nr:hypothetical protein [Planctomycetia bacterium]
MPCGPVVAHGGAAHDVVGARIATARIATARIERRGVGGERVVGRRIHPHEGRPAPGEDELPHPARPARFGEHRPVGDPIRDRPAIDDVRHGERRAHPPRTTEPETVGDDIDHRVACRHAPR